MAEAIASSRTKRRGNEFQRAVRAWNLARPGQLVVVDSFDWQRRVLFDERVQLLPSVFHQRSAQRPVQRLHRTHCI